MDNYYVELGEINSTAKALEKASGQWQAVLTKISSANEAMMNTDTISGKTADSIKEYISSVHTVLLARMQLLLMAVYTTFGTYNNAYLKIDDDVHTAYSTQELCELIDELGAYRKVAADVDGVFANEETIANPKLDSIGYANVVYNDVSGLLSRFDKIIQNVKDICDKTEHIETTFPDDLLTDLKTDLSNIRTLITEQMSTNPGTFDPQSLAKSQAFINLVEGYESAYQTVNDQMADAQAAAEGRAKCEQQLIEEREEEAKKWRVLTAIACTTVNIVATATCGPAGTIIAGAVTGAIEAAVNEGLDQYVATGAGWGELDWGSIAIEGAFGGLKGGLTSAIGCGVTGKLNAIGSTASAWSKGLQTAGWNLLGNAGKTTTNHLLDGAKEFTFALVDGKDLKEAWNAGKEEFTDGLLSDYCGDMVSAGFSGVNAGISTRYSGKDDKWKKTVGNVVSSTMEKPAEGVVTRFGAALQGEGEWSDVLDGKQIAKDAGSGFAEGLISEGVSYTGDKIKEKTGFDDWQKTRGNKAGKSWAAGGATFIESFVEKEASGFTNALIQSEGDWDQTMESWGDSQGDIIVGSYRAGLTEGMETKYKHDKWKEDTQARVKAGQPNQDDIAEQMAAQGYDNVKQTESGAADFSEATGEGKKRYKGALYVDKKTGEKATVTIDFEGKMKETNSVTDETGLDRGKTAKANSDAAHDAYTAKVGHTDYKKNKSHFRWTVHSYDPLTGEAQADYVRDPLTEKSNRRNGAAEEYIQSKDVLSDYKGELKSARGSSTSGDGANFIGSSDNTGGSGGFTIDNRSDEFQNLRNMLGL